MPIPIIDPDQLAITAKERRVIERCNEERAKHGLTPLGVNLSATRAATWKSINMASTGLLFPQRPGRAHVRAAHRD